MKRRPSEAAIAIWVMRTCLLFGCSTATQLEVARLFILALKETS